VIAQLPQLSPGFGKEIGPRLAGPADAEGWLRPAGRGSNGVQSWPWQLRGQPVRLCPEDALNEFERFVEPMHALVNF
jgi:hypothetical protein